MAGPASTTPSSSGTFSLDGETFDVDNNIWVVGDDTECVVIDAPHSVDDILAVVGDRKVKAILCTHAHDDHVPGRARAARARSVAPIMLHPDDRPLWELTHTDYLWDVDLADGFEIDGRRHHAAGAAHPGPRARARSASTPPTSAASSPATPSSRAARAPPAGRSATRT